MRAPEPIGDDELDALFRPLQGRRLALAVSGGVDSMVLLYLVARWLATMPPQASVIASHDATPASLVGMPSRRPSLAARAAWLAEGYAPGCDADRFPDVIVLTVDHGLRADSADDAAFVAEAARRLGLPVQILRWVQAAGSTADDVSAGPLMSRVQERARAARYDLLADAIEDEVWAGLETGASAGHPLGPAAAKRAITTAHHADDQIETFAMRLQRGTGLDGLAAMRAVETFRRPPTAARNYLSCVDVCRPLLAIPKDRLRATAQHRAIAWREDRSNEDTRFERTRLRRDAPRLEALGYGPPALQRTIGRLQSARAAMEHELRLWMHGGGQRKGIFRAHGGLFGEIVLSADAERDPPPYLLLGMLRRAIAAWGGHEPELSQLETLVEELGAAMGGATRFARTLANCRIDVVSEALDPPTHRVRIWREAGRRPLPEIRLDPGDGGWWDDRFAISVAASAPAAVSVRALGAEGVADLKRRAGGTSTSHAAPPGAYATLPAIWHNGALITVPAIDNSDPSDRIWLTSPAAEYYRARFEPVGEL
jgi:tRNA(Ile)-lysidine synthase